MTFPSLADPATENPARFGGKSAHLAGLAARGFPIPAGFAIPTETLLDWQTPLLRAIEAEIAKLETAGETLVSARIAELFLATPLGSSLRDKIGESCRAFLPAGENTLVAIRSSAVGEDAAEASFAGQFESFLGIRGLDQIADALRRVWASLYSPRAIRYRKDTGMPAEASPMGVAVLQMVDAVAAGVAFSVDVVTGKRDRIVIEATHGLAEPLVQGLITPDRYVVDKAEARLMTVDIGSKTLLCALDKDGGTCTSRPSITQQNRASLGSEQAENLAQIILRLEDCMGYPVDIEWAIGSDNQLHLLQVRPISTITPVGPEIRWNRAGSLTGIL